MTEVTAEQLLTVLRQTKLVPDANLNVIATDPTTATGRQLTDRLVSANLLTGYQADLLLSGRANDAVIGGKYTVLDQLGSGGMGRVYLCRHTGLGTLVAVKVLSQVLDDPTAQARFYREARAFASLNHPNLVRGFDVDADGGRHFLVMEYVDGVDLQALVQSTGRLSVERAVNYVRQAARGLSHAHTAGWVHRDVKPSNLAVDRAGVVRVLDMGLARLVFEGGGGLTRNFGDESIRGTADYMAPEQAAGATADGRTDLYSLGVTLYYLLTARLPFDETTTASKLVAHAVKPPRPIREVRREVPEGLAAVVARLMAKRPAGRYQSADELVDALAPWDTGSVPPAEAELPPPRVVVGTEEPTVSLGHRPPSKTPSAKAPPPVRKPVVAVAVALFGAFVALGLIVTAVVLLVARPSDRGAAPPTTAPTASPFWGNYVCVTRAHGPGQMPFPGGHNEYLGGSVYRSVEAALSDPRVRDAGGCRILLLDEFHEEQAQIEAETLPAKVTIESARPWGVTQWCPPDRTDPTRPLLTIRGGHRLEVRRLIFNGMRRVDRPLVWDQAGDGCRVSDCRVTLFTHTGVTVRNPVGRAADPVELAGSRVDAAAETAVESCVAVLNAPRTEGVVRITGCRLEGPSSEAVLLDGLAGEVTLHRCRLFNHASGVRLAAGRGGRLEVTNCTTARVTNPVAIDPRVEAGTRIVLGANLFVEANAAVRGLRPGAAALTDEGANWCEAGGCPIASPGLTLSPAEGLAVGLDPANDAQFLRYPRASSLRTAGPGGKAVGDTAEPGLSDPP